MGIVKGAGGLVFNREGHVLVIRHRDGSWVFPKGHIDEGENALQAAIREVEEEAGITATCAEPETSFTTSYVNPAGEQRSISWFIFQTNDSEPLMREKLFPEGAFVAGARALELLTWPEDRRLLEEALDYRARHG
jgi:diadenosine hexaphosphate hydrolase (ATP-forming)